MATENKLFYQNMKFIQEDFNNGLIRRDIALRVIMPENADHFTEDQLVILLTARKKLKSVPTVDAVDVVHGRWIDVRGIPSVNRKDVPVVKCSKCEIYFCDLINNHHYMYHYCPNCGAKMDGDGNGQ